MAVLHVNFYSSSLVRPTDMMVILPVDKFLPAGVGLPPLKPFKTLYLLHGLIGDCHDWLENAAIRRLCENKDLAVVMPSGENAFYVDGPGFGHRYGEFIGKELVEMSRRMFPLSRKREDTFIAGLSMGGYGAIRNGFKYAETFSHIGSFSGALHLFETDRKSPFGASDFLIDPKKAKKSDLNPRVAVEEMKKRIEASQYPKVYLSCGEKDDLLEANLKFRDFLVEEGIETKWHTLPGAHEWDVWKEEIRNFLAFVTLGWEEAGISSGNVE